MGKPKLTSINKGPFLSKYGFSKDECIPRTFYRFFLNLGFTPDDLDLQHFLCTEDHDDIEAGEKFISIKNLEDFYYNLKNEVYDLDFFIGHKKVFLIIRTKKDLQQEISDKLFKFVEMEDGN